MVEKTNVVYADDIKGAVAVMENLLAQGVTEVRAKQQKGGWYQIEYKVEEKE